MSLAYHKLKVKEIHKTTVDCAVISFEVPEELEQYYKYNQGQYLTLRAKINQEEVVRSYSLCSSPLDKEWKVGIKQIEDGKFSTFANEVLKVGDMIDVASPNGNFYIETNPELERNYIAFAAGSGITPMLSIIKTHLEAEEKASFKLFYINKTVASIILKEELEALKNIYMDRFEIYYFLTKEHRSVPLLNGRLDKEKMESIFSNICKTEEIDHYFSCGPEAMVLMIKDFLLEKNVDSSAIHYELFHAEGAAPEIKEKLKEEYKGKTSEVTLYEGGKTLNFTIPQASDNILDAALKNAADLPFACKGGVCCTCKAKLIEGEVNMLLNYGLEEEEIADGYILTCQALPITDKVVVDFDQ